MYYATHAMSPIAALAGSRIEKVVCFGSGTMRPELRCRYGNPFPAETALLRFENGLAGEVTREHPIVIDEFGDGLVFHN